MPYLAQHKNRPFVAKLSMADLPVTDVLKNYFAYRNTFTVNQISPEIVALRFYGMNTVMAKIMSQYGSMDELPAEIEGFVDSYHDYSRLEFFRMFYYMLFITARESRHVRKLSGQGWSKIKQDHPVLAAWHDGATFGDSDSVAEKLQDKPPPGNLGEFVDFILNIYAKGHFESSYGGKAWWNVTKPLRDFVHGEITAEMLMDTAFTLAHNCGPIFNKGMLFHHQSNADLQMILDVQRAGMIPAFVKSEFLPSKYAGVVPIANEWIKLFPDLDHEMDWAKVEQMGSVGKYGELKSKAQKAAEAAEKAKKLEAEKAAAAAKKALEFEVMPGVIVHKYVRTKEAA